MIIRKAQVEALEKTAVDNFVLEMAQHCEEFSPHLTKTLKKEQLRNAVWHGIDKAEKYGFTQRGPVRLFIDLMIVFGSGFDTDPQYPWITEKLNQGREKETDNPRQGEPQETKNEEPDAGQVELPDTEESSDNDELTQLQRSEVLFEKTAEYLKKVDGEKNKYTLEALQKLSDEMEKGLSFQKDNFDAGILELMKEMHPRKYEETGEENLQKLVRQSRRRAIQEYEFKTPREVALMVVLSFAFGHEFDKDPFLPWIAKTLNKENIPPKTKAEELEKRAVIWLKAVLKNAKEAN